MSGSFFGEGNFYMDSSILTNSSTSNTIITTSKILSSTIDMLSTSGNYQNITNVATPIQSNDVAIKSYVDSLGISIQNYTLSNTLGSLISTNLSGSFIITVKNLVLNGPSAVFIITKNEQDICGQVTRTTAAPGTGTRIALDISWPINSGIFLFKNGAQYDGSYKVKII
jgi:hypothetical protein